MGKQILLSTIVAASVAAAVALMPTRAIAEEGIDEIENMLSKEESQAAPAEEAPAPPKQTGELRDVSDLAKLSPMSDIAVIQKRFLPKTGRFEAFGALSSVLNDAFFMSFGLNLRLAYYFRERYGIELMALGLTTSERQVTSDLRDKRGVVTTSLVTPKSYFGADFKWTPVYGKMAWRNRTITPFDLYFSFGAGSTSTNQGSNDPTLHFGTGQTFALTKASAFRWDFSWNTYQSKSSSSSSNTTSLYNNLFISVGMSYFFPEATYR
jgi:outer membrane beta-barrel protein